MIREISLGAIATAGAVLALIGGSGYSLFQHPTPQREAPSKLEQTVHEETGYKAGPRRKSSIAKASTPTYVPGVRSTSKVTTTPQTAPSKAAPSVGSSTVDPFVGPPFTNPQLPYVPPSTTPTAPTHTTPPATLQYEKKVIPINFLPKDIGASNLTQIVEKAPSELLDLVKLPIGAMVDTVVMYNDRVGDYVAIPDKISARIKQLQGLKANKKNAFSNPDSDSVVRVEKFAIDYSVTSSPIVQKAENTIRQATRKGGLYEGNRRAVEEFIEESLASDLKDKYGQDPSIVKEKVLVKGNDGLHDLVLADQDVYGFGVVVRVPVKRAAIPNSKTDLDSVVAKLSGFGINVDLNRGYSLSKPTAQPTSSQSIASKPSLFSRFTNKVSASYNAARETVGSCLDEVVHAAVPSTKETVTLDLNGRNKNFKEKKSYSSIENKLSDLSPIHSRAAQEATKSGWFSRVKSYASKAVNTLAENSIAAVENFGYAAMPSSESFVKIGINDVTSNKKPSTYQNLHSKISEHTATLKQSATKSMQYAKNQASEVKETLSGIASNFGYAFKPSSEKFNALKIDNNNTYDTMNQDSIGDSYERKSTFLRLFSGGSFEAPKETTSDKISKGFGKFFGKVKQSYQATRSAITNTAGGLYDMGREAVIPGRAEYNTLDLERENRPLRETAFESRASSFEGLAKHYI